MITKPTKYTKEFVTEELKGMLVDLEKNEGIYLLGDLINFKKDYPRQVFSEWEKKFKDDQEISNSIKKIRAILEDRINKGGLNNKLNATMVIFNLKNHYGWKDKNETDLTSLGRQLGFIMLPPLKPA